MDPEVSVMLHCAPSQGLEEHQVQVEISSRFNRRSVSEIEEHIEAVWNGRVTKEPWLFNGAKFRLHAAKLDPSHQHTRAHCCNTKCDEITQTFNCETAEMRDNSRDKWSGCRTAHNLLTPHCDKGDEASVAGIHTSSVGGSGGFGETVEEPQKDVNTLTPKNCSQRERVVLSLQLGLTCYKDFLGTNWSQEAVELQRRGKVQFGDPQALLAQPLGVGAVMVTSDGQVVLLRRSQRVAEAAGLLDIPGGHPEPKAVCPGVSEEEISTDLLEGLKKAVVAEIFSSVCAEIRDEVNVPLHFLSPPLLMGIALNHTSTGRPSAEFYIRCSLMMEEVKEYYRRGGPEAHESTDIVFLSTKEMLQLDMSAPLWSELCPSAKGAVLLYQLVRPDQVQKDI